MKNVTTPSTTKNSTGLLTINGRPASREEYKRIFGTLPVASVETVDEEYEAWKIESGLSQPLSREEYVSEFSIY